MSTPVKVGSEVLVNSVTTDSQTNPSISALADGRFVVVWMDNSQTGLDTDGYAVRARIMEADGTPTDTEWLVNEIVSGSQVTPAVTTLADGRIAVTWTDSSGMTGDSEYQAVHFRVFETDGTPVTQDLRANTTTSGYQSGSSITALASGGFVIAWNDYSEQSPDNDGYAVRARMFDADGDPVSDEWVVNTTTVSDQWLPSVTALSNGGFVVTWQDDGGDGSASGLRYQVYDHDGVATGPEGWVNTQTANRQYQPKVAALSDGFVVVWADESLVGGDSDSAGIKAQRFSGNGTPVGGEILVNTATEGEQVEPVVIGLEDGRFVVAWTDYSGDDGSSAGVFAQLFGSDGSRMGEQFQVNTTSTGIQNVAAITALGSNRIAMTWTNMSSAEPDIRAQVFDVPGPPIDGSDASELLTGTNLPEQMDGKGGNDTILGLDGNDSMIGGAGNDRLVGGKGNDIMLGGAGIDTMIGGAGNDIYEVDSLSDRVYETTTPTSAVDAGGTDMVVSTVSWTLGSFFEYLALAGSGNINGTGNGLANTITGTPGNNVLDGKGGHDILLDLIGGDDTHIGGTGLDQIVDGGGSDVYLIAAGSHHPGAEISDIGLATDDEVRFTSTTAGDTLTLFAGDTGIDWVRMVNAAGTTMGSVALNVNASAMGHKLQISGNNGTNRITGTGYNDTLHGMGGNDTLTGGDGVDSMGGGSGDDRLDGGTGADLMDGGSGNDTYVVDNAGDQIHEGSASATEIDTVESSVDWVLGTHLERLVLTGSEDTEGHGNALNNRITGNSGHNLLMGMAGKDELIGGAGNDTLQGGEGVDTLRGGSGDDTYVLDTAGDQAIEARAADGDDLVRAAFDYTLGSHLEHLELLASAAVRGTGNELANRITGNSGHNVLKGLAGNDTLFGGTGDDTLIGGRGVDVMDGEAGSDRYLIASGSEHTAAEINDTGVSGTDIVRFTSTVAGDTLRLFSGDTGIEVVEAATADGNRSGTVALNIDASAALNGLMIIGNAGNNQITGTWASDVIDGGAGNDVIDGGSGMDFMDGGRGNDTYVVDHMDDQIQESDASLTEIDTVEASVNWTLQSNLERLVLTGTLGLTGIGNELANRITGNSGDNLLLGMEGRDELIGGAGNDTMQGGDGVDTLRGGAGDDTYVLDTVGDQAIETRAADGQDQVLTTFDYTLGSHLEHLELLNVMGEMAVRGTGNELANRITGNSMDNILKGLAGNDTLFGGAGNDTLHGGTGLDALDGGDDNDVYLIARGSEHTAAEIADSGSLGNDVVRLASAVSGDTLRLFAGDTGIEVVEVANADGNRNGTVALNIDASAVLGALTMLGNAGHNRLTGGAASDTMDGGDGSDRLDGGGGVDRMTGGRGNDTYVVDDVQDEVIESGTSLTEIDTVEAWVNWALGANTERLVLKGTDNLNGAGNALANRLTGNSGNNELDGGAGKDTMLGGAGDDTYVVDNAGDRVYETTVIDGTVNAGGQDTVKSSISYTLGTFIENLELLDGAGHINGTGNNLDNTLQGNNANNLLKGGAGDDILYGGQGDDILVGGTGEDWLIGDAGSDVFRFDSPLNASTNVDHILDFEKGADQIELMTSVFTRLSASGWNADKFRVFDTTPASIQGLDANDFILYDRSTGDLFYDRDGSGNAAAVKFAMLQSGTLLEWTDFLIS